VSGWGTEAPLAEFDALAPDEFGGPAPSNHSAEADARRQMRMALECVLRRRRGQPGGCPSHSGARASMQVLL